MPSPPIQVLTFNSAQDVVHMSWAEPYVTSGLNQRDIVVRPRGTYRGFRLTATGSDTNVSVIADPVGQDHVAVVYDNTGTYALELRRTGGSYIVDLSSVISANPSQTVVLALVGFYTPGLPTSVALQAYTIPQFQNAPESLFVAVLGTATLSSSLVTAVGYGVPTGAIGTPSTISPLVQRTEAWATASPESVAWTPILQNGGFDRGPTGVVTGYDCAGWFVGTSNANFTLETTDVNPSPGPNLLAGYQALELDLTAGGGHGSAVQTLGVPVAPGQLLQYRFWVKGVTPTSGNITIALTWLNASGGNVLPAFSVNIPYAMLTGLGTPGNGWQQLSGMVTVPATAVALNYMLIQATAVYSVTSGPVFRIDDAQVWVETNSTQHMDLARELRRDEVSAGWLVLQDPNASPPSDFSTSTSAPVLRYDSTFYFPSAVVLERKDQSATAVPPYLNVKGAMTLGQNLLGTGANAQIARLELPLSTVTPVGSQLILTLLQETPPQVAHTATFSGDRTYVSTGGDYYVVNNASWSNSSQLWTMDDPVAGTAVALLISSEANNNAFNILIYSAVPTTWTNAMPPTLGGWTTESVLSDFSGNMLLPSNLSVAGNETLGSSLLGTNALDNQPRLIIPADKNWTFVESAQLTLISESLTAVAGGQCASRQYVAADGSLWFTNNCRYNNNASSSTWIPDDTTAPAAFAFVMVAENGVNGPGAVSVFSQKNTGGGLPSSWSWVGWTNQVTLSDNAGNLLAATVAPYTSAPAVAVTPVKNTLYQNNIVKAWCTVYVGTGYSSAPQLAEGFNVASVQYQTAHATKDTLQINFSTDMADTNYLIIAQMSADVLGFYTGTVMASGPGQQQPNFCQVICVDQTGAPLSMVAGNYPNVYVTILGAQ